MRRNRLSLLLCALALCLAGGVFTSAGYAAGPDVLFNGDFDTGDLSQWNSVGFPERQAPDRIRVVGAPTDRSSRAGRFEVRPGDNAGAFAGTRRNRAEVGCTYLATACVPESGPDQVGQDVYFGWSTLFPQAEFPVFNPPSFFDGQKWQIIMQLNRSGSTPPISVSVVGNELTLLSTSLTSRFTYLYRAPLRRDHWYRFALRVFHSPDPGVGFVEFWIDGKLVTPRTYVPTMRQNVGGVAVDEGGTPVPNTPKLGLYRQVDTPVTQVVYHDNFKLGRTRAAVDPSATPGATPGQPAPVQAPSGPARPSPAPATSSPAPAKPKQVPLIPAATRPQASDQRVGAPQLALSPKDAASRPCRPASIAATKARWARELRIVGLRGRATALLGQKFLIRYDRTRGPRRSGPPSRREATFAARRARLARATATGRRHVAALDCADATAVIKLYRAQLRVAVDALQALRAGNRGLARAIRAARKDG